MYGLFAVQHIEYEDCCAIYCPDTIMALATYLYRSRRVFIQVSDFFELAKGRFSESEMVDWWPNTATLVYSLKR